jgi:hypothetical protein
MPNEVRSKIVSELKLKTPVHEQALKTEFEEENRSSPFRDVDTVVYEVDKRGLLGDFLDYKPWFRARLDVRAVLLGTKVFYVGNLRNAGIIPVDYAMQCSLENVIGIENHRQEIERMRSTYALKGELRVQNMRIAVGGFTSGNAGFAADLLGASSLVDRSEAALLVEKMSELEPRQFFKSKEDYESHERYKPNEQDQQVLSKFDSVNDRIRRMMSGSLTPLRRGLLDLPRWSLRQTLRNLGEYRALRKSFGPELIDKKIDAIRKMSNFRTISKRATTDAESRVLNAIMSVAHMDATTSSVEIVGIRLLDGYYRRKGYDTERRVVLGSPLYIA